MDAGYCKCPDRIRDVQASNPYETNGYGRQGASPPSAIPQSESQYQLPGNFQNKFFVLM